MKKSASFLSILFLSILAPGLALAQIDFSIWELQEPSGSGTSPTIISTTQLVDGYSDDYFYIAGDGGQVFMDTATGITTSGSVHPRCEMREMSGGAGAAWAPTGTNTETVTGQVLLLGDGTSGHTTIAQVFNSTLDIPLCEFQYDGGVGGFEILNEEAKGAGTMIDMDTPCALNTKYTFQLSLSNDVLTVTINGAQVYTHTPSASILTDQFYFKCGNYDQTAVAGAVSTTPYTEVEDYAITVYHGSGTPTPTPTNSSTATNTPTGTSAFTGTFTPTKTFTATRTFTGTFTNTRTSTPAFTNTTTSTPTATSTKSDTPAFTGTDTATATHSGTPTFTLSATPTASATGTATDSPTFANTSTPSLTSSHTPILTATASTTPMASPTSTNSAQATVSSSSTPTQTPASTRTSTPANSPTFTPSATRTASATGTVTPSQASTSSPTLTDSPALTSTKTFTQTATQTFTPSPTLTATPSSTPTGIPTSTQTLTPTSTRSLTPTTTLTPTFTAVHTNTSVFTATATQTTTRTPTKPPTALPTGSPTPVVYPNPGNGGPVWVMVPGLKGTVDVDIELFTTAFRKVQWKSYPNLPAGGAVGPVEMTDQWGNKLSSGLYYVVVTATSGTGGAPMRMVGKMLLIR